MAPYCGDKQVHAQSSPSPRMDKNSEEKKKKKKNNRNNKKNAENPLLKEKVLETKMEGSNKKVEMKFQQVKNKVHQDPTTPNENRETSTKEQQQQQKQQKQQQQHHHVHDHNHHFQIQSHSLKELEFAKKTMHKLALNSMIFPAEAAREDYWMHYGNCQLFGGDSKSKWSDLGDYGSSKNTCENTGENTSQNKIENTGENTGESTSEKTSDGTKCNTSLKYVDNSKIVSARKQVKLIREIDLNIGELLGQGGFCEVRRVTLKYQEKQEDKHEGKHRTKQYAMKYLSPSRMQAGPNAQQNSLTFQRGIADLVTEARFLSVLDHSNIIRLHYICHDSLERSFNIGKGNTPHQDRQYGYFMLLDSLHETLSERIERDYIPQVTMAHASGGSILSPRWWKKSHKHDHDHDHHDHRHCTRMDPKILLASRLKSIQAIARALQYLHDECHVIFRDVKPDNIGFYRKYHPICYCGYRHSNHSNYSKGHKAANSTCSEVIPTRDKVDDPQDGRRKQDLEDDDEEEESDQQHEYTKHQIPDECLCFDDIPKLFDFGLAKELKPQLQYSPKSHDYSHHSYGKEYFSRLPYIDDDNDDDDDANDDGDNHCQLRQQNGRPHNQQRIKEKHLHHHPYHPTSNDTFKLTGCTGSRRYMAPEVAFSHPYNHKADVYSFGLVLYQISSLIIPFDGYTSVQHEIEVLRNGKRPCVDSRGGNRGRGNASSNNPLFHVRNSWNDTVEAVKHNIHKGNVLFSHMHKQEHGDEPQMQHPSIQEDDKLSIKIKQLFPESLKKLMEDCWDGDMRMRPDMKDVVYRLEQCIQELTQEETTRNFSQESQGNSIPNVHDDDIVDCIAKSNHVIQEVTTKNEAIKNGATCVDDSVGSGYSSSIASSTMTPQEEEEDHTNVATSKNTPRNQNESSDKTNKNKKLCKKMKNKSTTTDGKSIKDNIILYHTNSFFRKKNCSSTPRNTNNKSNNSIPSNNIQHDIQKNDKIPRAIKNTKSKKKTTRKKFLRQQSTREWMHRQCSIESHNTMDSMAAETDCQ